jgi:D-3-phosphoglycerate dehydrogenase
MRRFKVVMVANDMPPTPDWVRGQLDQQGVELLEHGCATPAEVERAAGEADVVWVMGGSCVVTAEALPRLRRCRAILRTGTGTDNIPVDAATRRGIVVAHTPEATMHQVAEHALGLLLAVTRKIAAQDRLVRQGIWDRDRAWPDWHLVGQTLGLLGFGRIARLLARKVSGLEMKIVACDPAVEADTMAESSVEKVGLDDLLRRSNFLSVHVPLSERTRHLIGERELRLMNRRAVLINTSRGPIIDQTALTRALSDGWIAAAGLDVLETEPPGPDDPLVGLDNVVLTPHIASYSDVFHDRFWQHSVETLVALSEGRPPPWVANPGVSPWWLATREPTG